MLLDLGRISPDVADFLLDLEGFGWIRLDVSGFGLDPRERFVPDRE